jgi:hypothetical protein
MHRLAAALLAAGLLATTMPAQAAVHGVDWTATGVLATTGGAQGITVAWNGCLGCTSGVFTVTLRDVVSGTVLSQAQFLGSASFNERNLYNTAFVLVSGQSTTAGVNFNFVSQQVNGLGGGFHYINQVVAGAYQGNEFVAYTLLQPWNFS